MMDVFAVALVGSFIFGMGVASGVSVTHWLTRESRSAAAAQLRFFLAELFDFLQRSKLSGGELASIVERKLQIQEKQIELTQLNKDSDALASRMRSKIPMDIEQR